MFDKKLSNEINYRVSTLKQIDIIAINKISILIKKSLEKNKKILVCGNGGSSAQSQHFVTELMVRYKKKRRPLPAIAMTTDTSILTAHGNDFSFDTIFNNQISSLGVKGDILLAFSTSGKSKNIINAIKIAKSKGLNVIGFTGMKKRRRGQG